MGSSWREKEGAVQCLFHRVIAIAIARSFCTANEELRDDIVKSLRASSLGGKYSADEVSINKTRRILSGAARNPLSRGSGGGADEHSY